MRRDIVRTKVEIRSNSYLELKAAMENAGIMQWNAEQKSYSDFSYPITALKYIKI